MNPEKKKIMESNIKIIQIEKKGIQSYDITRNDIKWTNVGNFQVVGWLADIIESELRVNEMGKGRYTITIKIE